ncbi:hypothetical protein F5Y16DRAFT_360191 [Xylariaceae sp. FL0255]|nr:hypothetical protein F5Y16DRAFT_360191 [Xylariaceae sp. FL0255]
MMHHIYRQASQVWVWLRCEHQRAETVTALAQQLGRIDFADNRSLESRGLPEPDAPIWKEAFDLLENPWLHRLWIIQEFLLAKQLRVLYSGYEIEWDSLNKAIFNCLDIRREFKQTYDKLFHANFIRNTIPFYVRGFYENPRIGRSWPSTLLMILILTIQYQRCSEPRDRVLALLFECSVCLAVGQVQDRWCVCHHRIRLC